jgi:hypothetical protein
MENIIEFFRKNKGQIVDFIDKISVNQEKTVVKFGAKSDHNISITFLIHGEPKKEIISIEDKLKCLLNTDEDLTELDKLFTEIDLPYHFSFEPYLKISKENEPLIHAFQITIIFESV